MGDAGKPKVFLGSSKESLPVLRVVERSLTGVAAVTPWTDDSFRRPGDYFLDSLLQAAPNFDVAVLVFGKDDVVISRHRRQPAPRDNVVFELGLFMSRLARNRTIVLAPRVWRTRLKILSDLQGLNLAEYDPPRAARDLPAALSEVCRTVKAHVENVGARLRSRGPSGVVMLWSQLEPFLARNAPAQKELLNMALDMEITWRFLHDHLLNAPDRTDVVCRCLFIDHKSPHVRRMSSRTVSVATVRSREREIREFCRRNSRSLKARRVKFECRAYSRVPLFHGFMINRKQLFISSCTVKDGRLVGAPNPYLFVERPVAPERDIGATHLFDVFDTWFEFIWERSRRVWPA